MNGKSWMAGLALAVIGIPMAFAAALHVAPISIQMAPGQSAATLTLKNEGDKPMHAQVRVFDWSQAQGKDNLGDTQTLIASPPAIDVAPQGSQTIRLVRTAKSTVTREESYRVLIDEIIDPATAPLNGVNVQLRYSVPVFMSPDGMKPPRMTVTASIEGQTLTLKAQNNGGQHANVSAVTLENAGGESVTVDAGLLGYVLVGQIMEWKLKLPPEGTAKGQFVTLRCRFNGEEFTTKL